MRDNGEKRHLDRPAVRLVAGKVLNYAFFLPVLMIFSLGFFSCGGEIELEDTPFITVSPANQFIINKNRIWINGVNTPWIDWNEFGAARNAEREESWVGKWDAEFAKLREYKINASRIWINCNNENRAILIDADGIVSGASDKHWADVDRLFELAAKHEIFIMATLLSFDHFKSREAASWRAMLNNDAATASFAENYTVPFVKRYQDNKYLWSIDLCNEPDWIHENSDCGKLNWERISYFMAVNAAAIHENSRVLVTVGIAYPRWNAGSNTAKGNAWGNKVSDQFLQGLYSNSNAYLDFWSTHYYDWIGKIYGVPFYRTPEDWQLDLSKPALIGECSASGTAKDTYGASGNTVITDYESAFDYGWEGVMAWTSNAVDNNGGLPGSRRPTDLGEATLNMYTKYPRLIYPDHYSGVPEDV